MPTNAKDANQSKLFIGKDGQWNLLNKSAEQMVRNERERKSAPVECLGHTFPGDAARREHYLKLLTEKLKDPEFRKTPGFPKGTDEDILRLSDPPYYTACPNPFAAEFVAFHNRSKTTQSEYSREPFAFDVTEGTSDVIYNAHTYHTKVPPLAIAQYILHYTSPGDIVLDGFCGTGMTGVAAQLCADPAVVRSLGYEVSADGLARSSDGRASSRVGARYTVLAELSPAATCIARGYSTSFSDTPFAEVSAQILATVENTLCQLFSTINPKTGGNGVIDFTVMSDVFTCEQCGHPIVLWDAVVDPATRRRVSRDAVPCPQCKHVGDIRQMKRCMESFHDAALGTVRERVRQEPILIQFRHGDSRFEKVPDAADRSLARGCDAQLQALDVPYPALPMPGGLRKAKDAYHLRGITHVHHFYTSRSLIAFATLWAECARHPGVLGHQLRFWLTSVALGFTKLNRYFESSYSQVNRYMKGALYVAPFIAEVRPGYALAGKIKKLSQLSYGREGRTLLTTGSSTCLPLPDACIDYVFTDPPFGRNIQYSELNFVWECWLGVRTNSSEEAIVDETIGKENANYHGLMQQCFAEFYRVLKPGRWITVEFHNAENAIWAIIQESLARVGFVVADVRVLDKQQITMQQWVGTNVVSKDLIITAYKPTHEFETKFKLEAGTVEGVWDFVRAHLKQLPVFVAKGNKGEVIAERQDYLLFDRMVAFHVQRGVTVPVAASEFYEGLGRRCSERDGMYLLPEQVAEYDRKRMTVSELAQLELFVNDESSAIQWLRRTLHEKPQSFQDLQPQFMQETRSWDKHEKPLDLRVLLEENFLGYDGTGEVPSQIHRYLSSNMKDSRNLAKDDPSLRAKASDRWFVPDPKKATDLEKLREKSLLKEFEAYNAPGGKKLKVFRLEAVRAGFKKAWEARDYKTIIEVAKRIPEDVLQEDQKLVMWYDNALTRAGVE